MRELQGSCATPSLCRWLLRELRWGDVARGGQRRAAAQRSVVQRCGREACACCSRHYQPCPTPPWPPSCGGRCQGGEDVRGQLLPPPIVRVKRRRGVQVGVGDRLPIGRRQVDLGVGQGGVVLLVRQQCRELLRRCGWVGRGDGASKVHGVRVPRGAAGWGGQEGGVRGARVEEVSGDALARGLSLRYRRCSWGCSPPLSWLGVGEGGGGSGEREGRLLEGGGPGSFQPRRGRWTPATV